MQGSVQMLALMTSTWFVVPQKNLYLLALEFAKFY